MRRRIDAELADESRLVVAVEAERIVGMLAIKTRSLILDQLFVAPERQREGIGKTLLDFANKAKPGGFTLRASLANARARRFYEKQGRA